MSPLTLRLLSGVSLLIQVCFASPMPSVSHVQAPAFVFDGDAPYDVPLSNLSSILTCPTPLTSASKPALLVHGTGSTGNESWSGGYVPALSLNGYTPCFLNLPHRSMGDIQTTAEYIAYNIHAVSQMAGGNKVVVFGHSQGNADIQWALRFWPSTRALTAAFVALSPVLAGAGTNFSHIEQQLCALGHCAPAIWQQAAGSNFYTALNYHKQAWVPTTTIYSQFDEIYPNKEDAQLPGATVVALQDACPLRPVDHILMLFDAVGFALALDALRHEGHANVDRVLKNMPNLCTNVFIPGYREGALEAVQGVVGDLVLGLILGDLEYATPSEPTIKDYAKIETQSQRR